MYRHIGSASLIVLAAAVMGSQVRAEELVVSAAISLKECFLSLGEQFEHQYPGSKIVFNFAASGALASQIEQGAPADVFAAASYGEINRLDSKHLIQAGSIKPFARNKLVVIVPRSARRLSSFEELSTVEHVTIGNPDTVPAGRYAAHALGRSRIYQNLLSQHRLVLAESVRQALAYVQSGNVDAGIVYLTDVRSSNQVVVCFSVPDALCEPIVYPIAVVQDSKHVKLGLCFIEFIRGATGRSVLKKMGFPPADK